MATRDKIRRLLKQDQESTLIAPKGSKAELFLKDSSKKANVRVSTIVKPNVDLLSGSLFGSGSDSDVAVGGKIPKLPEDEADRPSLEDIEIVLPPTKVVDENGIKTWEYVVYVKNTSKKEAVDIDIYRSKAINASSSTVIPAATQSLVFVYSTTIPSCPDGKTSASSGTGTGIGSMVQTPAGSFYGIQGIPYAWRCCQ